MRTSLTSWAGAAFAAALLTAPLGLSTALGAERVGVAAAVKPEATSQPPGGATTTLNIGKSVLYNERIATSTSGQVQVLLLDGSTFTVGPGSNLVIAGLRSGGLEANTRIAGCHKASRLLIAGGSALAN